MNDWPESAWWQAVEQVSLAIESDLSAPWQAEAARRFGAAIARDEVRKLLSHERWAERLCNVAPAGWLPAPDGTALHLLLLLMPSRRAAGLEEVAGPLGELRAGPLFRDRPTLPPATRRLLAAIERFAGRLPACMSAAAIDSQSGCGRAADALVELTSVAALQSPPVAEGFLRLVDRFAQLLAAERERCEERLRRDLDQLQIRLRDGWKWSAAIAAALASSRHVYAWQLENVPAHSRAWALQEYPRTHPHLDLFYEIRQQCLIQGG